MYQLNLDDAQPIPEKRRAFSRVGDCGEIIETDAYNEFTIGQNLRSAGWKDNYDIAAFFITPEGEIRILLTEGYVITLTRAREVLEEMNGNS